jgi:hypothetical protein
MNMMAMYAFLLRSFDSANQFTAAHDIAKWIGSPDKTAIANVCMDDHE